MVLKLETIEVLCFNPHLTIKLGCPNLLRPVVDNITRTAGFQQSEIEYSVPSTPVNTKLSNLPQTLHSYKHPFASP
jgi:hypothetical protein